MKKFISVILVVLLLLTGCGKVKTPSKAVDKWIKSIPSQKDELMKKYDIDLSELSKKNQKVLEKAIAMVLDSKYEILNEKIDGDKAIVDVKITSYDFLSSLPSVVTSILSTAFEMYNATDEEVEDKIFEILDESLTEIKKGGKTFSYTIKVPAIKKNGSWEVSKEAAQKVLLEPFENMLIGYGQLFK